MFVNFTFDKSRYPVKILMIYIQARATLFPVELFLLEKSLNRPKIARKIFTGSFLKLRTILFFKTAFWLVLISKLLRKYSETISVCV